MVIFKVVWLQWNWLVQKNQILTEIVSIFGLTLLGFIGANFIQLELNQERIVLLSHLNKINVHYIEGFLALSLTLIVHTYLSKKGLDLFKGLIFNI